MGSAAKAAECPIAGCLNSNGARLDMLRTVFVVSLLLLLSGVSLAQMSPAVEATPTASPATPEAGPSVSMVTATPTTGQQYPPQIMRWRAVRIVPLVLKALLVLSASFALIALGIFLIRRSR